MATREEIREGMEQIVSDMVYGVGVHYTSKEIVAKLQEYEASQGVAIKVEVEWEIGITDTAGTPCNSLCHNMERKLLKEDGYTLTEPLI